MDNPQKIALTGKVRKINSSCYLILPNYAVKMLKINVGDNITYEITNIEEHSPIKHFKCVLCSCRFDDGDICPSCDSEDIIEVDNDED
jgi:hypothetical protein